MGKKKATGTKNVYELAQERLKVIFNEFDNIYVSFSGGKDSGVLLNMCIDYIRKNNLKSALPIYVPIILASLGRQQEEYMGALHAPKGNDQG